LPINKLITTEQFSKGQAASFVSADCYVDNKAEVLLMAELCVTFCRELDVIITVI